MASRGKSRSEGPGSAGRQAGVVAAAVALLTALALGLPDSARAQVEATEIFRHRQGGYEMGLAVLPHPPKVGHVHFSITLSDVETSSDVTHAEITIVANDEGGEPAYQALALNTPQEPRFYEANISFRAAGSWSLEVSVDSPRLGATTFSVPMEVEVQSIAAAPEGTLVFIGLMVVLVGGAAYVWYSARRRTQQSERT